MKKIIILLGLLFVLPTLIFSQTITNYQSSFNAVISIGLGQSFTATLDGVITQIDVQPNIDRSNATLLIYATGNGSGILDNPGTPDYEQSGVNLTHVNPGSADWNNITLSTPFPITAGQQYSFVIEGYNNIEIFLYHLSENSYSGGDLILSYGYPYPWSELNFRVWESAPAPTQTPIRIWPFILLFTIPFVFILVRKMR